MITVVLEDLKSLISILQKSHSSYSFSLKRLQDFIITGKFTSKPYQEFDIFFNQILGEDKLFLNDCHDYFFNKYNQNIAEEYEHKILNNYWTESSLFAYVHLIKEGKYYPINESIIKQVIQKMLCSNNRTFWALVSLAGLVKDPTISAECFSSIITEKSENRNLSLLDLEKFKRSWDKRFKNVDIQKFSPESYVLANKFFDRIEKGKKTDLYSCVEGHFLYVVLEPDIISQHNKLTRNKNSEAISRFFNIFKNYIEKSKTAKDLFSISNFTIVSQVKINLQLEYLDISKKDALKLILNDLIAFALTKDGNKLKGASEPNYDNMKFFDSFMLNYNLQLTLPNKEGDSKKISKV